MKFEDLNGKVHNFNFNKICRDSPNPSKLHTTARSIIKKELPGSSIYEEVQLLGTGLIADFFIPDMRILIEVHGEQHYKFVKRFHKSKAGFIRSQKRDATKKEWCSINDITYIELPFDKVDEWAKIIKGKL
jgi:hypothetical protein